MYSKLIELCLVEINKLNINIHKKYNIYIIHNEYIRHTYL